MMSGRSKKRWPKTRRSAALMNLMLPGLGQIYLGQRVTGIFLVASFVFCIAAKVWLIVAGYSRYLEAITGDDLLAPGQLEMLMEDLKVGWFLIFVALTGVVAGLSFLLLYTRPAAEEEQPPPLNGTRAPRRG